MTLKQFELVMGVERAWYQSQVKKSFQKKLTGKFDTKVTLITLK